MREITLSKNDGGQPLYKFLSKALPKMPQSVIYKSIRKGRVRVNGKKTTDSRAQLFEGDKLSLYINDEFFETEPTKYDFLTAPANIDVVYEDENILLVNKAPALAVHDFEGAGTDTLINRIIRYLYDKKEYDPESESSFEYDGLAPVIYERIVIAESIEFFSPCPVTLYVSYPITYSMILYIGCSGEKYVVVSFCNESNIS